MKGYKAFNKDLTCRKFQFEIGKTYEHSGELSLCNSGFHFCTKLADCFSYYIFSDKPIICEVEILGKVLTDSQRDSKACTDKIKIIRKLSWDEVLNLSNSGYNNSGYNNSGNYNSGNCNSGFFNTNNPKLRLFNKETNYESSNEIYNKLQKLQKYSKPILIWVSENKMTDQEKKDNPKYETTKGYLKYTGKQKWDKLSKEDEDWLTSLPEFDSDIFFELTGLKLEKK